MELLYAALLVDPPRVLMLVVIGWGFVLTVAVAAVLAVFPGAHARCWPGGRPMPDPLARAFRAASTLSWGCLAFALAVHWGDVYWSVTPGNTPPSLTLFTRLGGIGASWWALTSVMGIRRDGGES